MKLGSALLFGAILIAWPHGATACEVMPPWIGIIGGQTDFVADGQITSVTLLPAEIGETAGVGESAEHWQVSVRFDHVILGEGPYPYELSYLFGDGCGVGMPPAAGGRVAVFVARDVGGPRVLYAAVNPRPASFKMLRDLGVPLPPRAG